MLQPKFALTYYLLFICLFVEYVSAQMSWRLNSEVGYYYGSGTTLLDQNDFLARLNGDFLYRFKKEKSRGSLKFKVRPELYGIGSDLRSLKMKGSGTYLFERTAYDLGFSCNALSNRYSNAGDDLNLNQIVVQSDLFLLLLSNMPLSFSLGFVKQQINFSVTKKLQLVFFETKIEHAVFSYLRLNYGGYLEQFAVDEFTEELDSYFMTGRRYGPVTGLEYLHKFYMRLDYRILLYDSDLTRNPSYEQWLRLTWAKVLSSKWSFFVFVDYFWRTLRPSALLNGQELLPYPPLNLENHFFLKLAYSKAPNSEVYAKLGYSNENLNERNYAFSLFTVVVGLQISK